MTLGEKSFLNRRLETVARFWQRMVYSCNVLRIANHSSPATWKVVSTMYTIYKKFTAFRWDL